MPGLLHGPGPAAPFSLWPLALGGANTPLAGLAAKCRRCLEARRQATALMFWGLSYYGSSLVVDYHTCIP